MDDEKFEISSGGDDEDSGNEDSDQKMEISSGGVQCSEIDHLIFENVQFSEIDHLVFDSFYFSNYFIKSK